MDMAKMTEEMKTLSTYEIQFMTTVDFYRKKLQPFNERIKQVFAENETQALEHGYQKLMEDFPTWEVKNIIKRADDVLKIILCALKSKKGKDRNAKENHLYGVSPRKLRNKVVCKTCIARFASSF